MATGDDVSTATKWRPPKTKIVRNVKTTFDMRKGKYAIHDWKKLCRREDGRDSSDSSASDTDDRLLSVAERAFLAKVNKKYGSKKKARKAMGPMQEWRMTLYKEGYDMEDPFIDDAMPTDDIVPQSLDTPYGGFYISKGEMTTRVVNDGNLSTSSSDEDQPPVHKMHKTAGFKPKSGHERAPAIPTSNKTIAAAVPPPTQKAVVPPPSQKTVAPPPPLTSAAKSTVPVSKTTTNKLSAPKPSSGKPAAPQKTAVTTDKSKTIGGNAQPSSSKLPPTQSKTVPPPLIPPVPSADDQLRAMAAIMADPLLIGQLAMGGLSETMMNQLLAQQHIPTAAPPTRQPSVVKSPVKAAPFHPPPRMAGQPPSKMRKTSTTAPMAKASLPPVAPPPTPTARPFGAFKTRILTKYSLKPHMALELRESRTLPWSLGLVDDVVAAINDSPQTHQMQMRMKISTYLGIKPEALYRRIKEHKDAQLARAKAALAPLPVLTPTFEQPIDMSTPPRALTPEQRAVDAQRNQEKADKERRARLTKQQHEQILLKHRAKNDERVRQQKLIADRAQADLDRRVAENRRIADEAVQKELMVIRMRDAETAKQQQQQKNAVDAQRRAAETQRAQLMTAASAVQRIVEPDVVYPTSLNDMGMLVENSPQTMRDALTMLARKCYETPAGQTVPYVSIDPALERCVRVMESGGLNQTQKAQVKDTMALMTRRKRNTLFDHMRNTEKRKVEVGQQQQLNAHQAPQHMQLPLAHQTHTSPFYSTPGLRPQPRP